MSDPYNDEHKIYDEFRFKNHIVRNEIHGLFQLTPGTMLFTRPVVSVRYTGFVVTLGDDNEERSFTILSRDKSDLHMIDTDLKQVNAFVSFGVDGVSFSTSPYDSYDARKTVKLYGARLSVRPKDPTQWNDDILYVVDCVLMK